MVSFLETSFLIRAFTTFDSAKYPFVSYHAQNYFGIVIYLLLAAAICSLLAAIAYLFSLSSVQDSEKRSEYECGFEPFDSATRLPFDVHFYLVGILFLIFDVEIALLFPWVLGLHTAGWFSFYIVLGFIVLLGVGFLYEWKRGALIWPSRQVEIQYTAQSSDSSLHSTVSTKLGGLSYLVKFARYNKIRDTTFNLEPVVTKKLTLFSKITQAFKKLVLAKRISKTKRALLRRKLTSLRTFVVSVAYAETKLAKYKKVIYFFIKKTLALSSSCRLINPGAELEIAKQEKFFFNIVTPVVREYSALTAAYKSIYKKLKNSLLLRHVKKLPFASQTKVRALRRYLLLQSKYFGRKNGRAKREKRLLRRQINPQSRFKSRRFSAKKKLVMLSPFVFTIDSSFTAQLLSDFLPELLLTAAILLNLTLLAIGLGEGRSKKELALESFSALLVALTFVAAIYVIQLFFGNVGSLGGGYASTSGYVVLLKLLTVVTGGFILAQSHNYLVNHPRHLLEYPIILTTAIFFMLLLVGSNHLVSAFLSLVGFSLNLYVLILFDAPSAIAREAGVKYFYLSTISSGLILYGIFLLFVILGTGNFYEMQQVLSSNTAFAETNSELLQLAIAFVLIGLFFKLSSFPGHLWAAEVYEGSPDPITAFFMLPVKVAVLGFVIQLLTVALEPAAVLWQPIVALSAIASLVWGCVAALAEKKTKRFLAYASINQIGFLLLGLATASQEGYRSTLFYLLLYAIMNIAFLTVFLNAHRADGKSLLYLTDFRGFGMKYGAYSWSVAVVLLSMAGIPPLAGFFGKYYLLLHAQEQGLTLLVITGLATSLISTYYYLRLVKIFWFEGSDFISPVECELSRGQASTLTLSECLLWTVSIYTAFVGLYLGDIVTNLRAPDAFTSFFL